MTTTAAPHARNLAGLMKALAATYEPPAPPERGPVDELVFSMLLWEANSIKAEAAFRRFLSSAVDFNELRVCKPLELEALMGKTYPRVEERAIRIKASLTDLYLREHAVSLDAAAAMSKRDSRKYLETLDGVPHFVASRVVLLRMGGHAMPVDSRLLELLKSAEVAEHSDDEEKAAGILERHIKAGEGAAAHLLLQAWTDDPQVKGPPEAPRKKKASAGGRGGTKGDTGSALGSTARKKAPRSSSKAAK